MEYWSGTTLDLALAFCLFRVILNIHRYGLRNLWRSLRLWGEGVTQKQRRENLAGLIVLLLLVLISVLFWLIP